MWRINQRTSRRTLPSFDVVVVIVYDQTDQQTHIQPDLVDVVVVVAYYRTDHQADPIIKQQRPRQHQTTAGYVLVVVDDQTDQQAHT